MVDTEVMGKTWGEVEEGEGEKWSEGTGAEGGGMKLSLVGEG